MSELQPPSIQTYIDTHPGVFPIDPTNPEAGYQAWDSKDPGSLTAILDPTAVAEREKSRVAFETSLDILAGELPEVAVKREAIRGYGEQLIHEFDIDEKLFDAPHSFFFAALADRYAQAHEPSISDAERIAEKEFVADALMLLAGDKSGHYARLKTSMGEAGHTDAYEKQVYDRFTNQQLTAELRDAINHNGLLDEARKRMGVTSDNEDPFVLKVLNVTAPNVDAGMRPAGYEDAKEYEAYIRGLQKNTDEFIAALGGGSVGVAWNCTLDGVRYLVMPTPIAEKLLYEEVHGPDSTEKIRKRDVGVVEHEFAHTQGGYNLDGKIYYGISAEEVRAEQLSNNRNGYQDVKSLVDDLSVAANFNIRSLIDAAPKGGTAEAFYTAVAAKIGLQNTLEFALITPTDYASRVDPNSIQGKVAAHVSGDALIERVYTQSMQDPQKAEQITSRIKRIAGMWQNSFDGGGMNIYYREQAGLKFMTTKITQEMGAVA